MCLGFWGGDRKIRALLILLSRLQKRWEGYYEEWWGGGGWSVRCKVLHLAPDWAVRWRPNRWQNSVSETLHSLSSLTAAPQLKLCMPACFHRSAPNLRPWSSPSTTALMNYCIILANRWFFSRKEKNKISLLSINFPLLRGAHVSLNSQNFLLKIGLDTNNKFSYCTSTDKGRARGARCPPCPSNNSIVIDKN